MSDPRSTPAVSAHPRVAPLPALTSLRFFAAAYVVAFHFGPATSIDPSTLGLVKLGYSGVTFFFLLSGFILAYNYRDAEFAAPQVRNLFYRARLARIYPVYLLSLVIHVPWFIAWVMKEPQPLAGLMASGAVFAPLGLHAWVPGAACSINCPSWSISVELVFYALLPFLLPLVLRAPLRVAVATLSFWLASMALVLVLWQAFGKGVSLIGPEPGGPQTVLLAEFIKYFPLLHLPEFLSGLLLFALWRTHRFPVPALLAIAFVAAFMLVRYEAVIPEPMLHNGLTMLAYAPLILACAAVTSGWLCTRPMIFLGKISFALYLLHMPVFAVINTSDRVVLHGALAAYPWISFCLCSLASLTAAALAHLYIEEPGRRFVLRLTERKTSEKVKAADIARFFAIVRRSPPA